MSRLTIVGLLALALCAVACTSKVTIGEIQNDAPTYDGKSVTLSGEVTSRLSLIFWKTYNLSDGTGEITVVTKKALPNVGAEMEVTGRVEEGFSLGSQQSLVLVDESAQDD
jgi:uncharacterized protein YdeI (BOF family)